MHNALSLAISMMLRLGSITILARVLVPEDFGLIGMVMAFTVVAERFKDLGLALPIVQTQRITHEQVSGLFWINVAFGFMMMAVVFMVGKPIAWFSSILEQN